MYEISWKGKPVGSASVNKEGLFFRMNCNCHLPEAGVYRVQVTDESNTYDLGICVPEGKVYTCVARVPCKRFSGNNLSFNVREREERLSVPVEDGKPFLYLDKLSTARLRFANGQPEIIIDPIQDQQDNGRNPTHGNK